MTPILEILQVLSSELSGVNLGILSEISKGIFRLTGSVTGLNISRYNDYDLCQNLRNSDTSQFQILVIPPTTVASTLVSSSLNYDTVNQMYFDTLQIMDLETFTFEVTDTGGDDVELTLEGDNFTLASLGATFQTQGGQGSIQGNFAWQTTCNMPSNTTDFIWSKGVLLLQLQTRLQIAKQANLLIF